MPTRFFKKIPTGVSFFATKGGATQKGPSRDKRREKGQETREDKRREKTRDKRRQGTRDERRDKRQEKRSIGSIMMDG